MATIEKRGETYRITVSAGYDLNGKQIRYKKTWKPDEGMTKRQTVRQSGSAIRPSGTATHRSCSRSSEK